MEDNTATKVATRDLNPAAGRQMEIFGRVTKQRGRHAGIGQSTAAEHSWLHGCGVRSSFADRSALDWRSISKARSGELQRVLACATAGSRRGSRSEEA